jgi:hypothetical protein
VKLLGNGVNDYGGPYRAVFEKVFNSNNAWISCVIGVRDRTADGQHHCQACFRCCYLARTEFPRSSPRTVAGGECTRSTLLLGAEDTVEWSAPLGVHISTKASNSWILLPQKTCTAWLKASKASPLYHWQGVFIEPPLSNFLHSRRAHARKKTCAPIFLS